MRASTRSIPALALLLLLPGCATLQEMAALRSVAFAFDRVSDLRLAGVSLTSGMRFADLSLGDAARVTAAVVSRSVPLELVAHVGATNPAENRVAARMLSMDWSLFVEDRQALTGRVGDPVAISPGQTADVPVRVQLDLMALGSGGARDLFDLAMGIAGQGSAARELRMELVPTIETSLGPMRYPAPIVVRRAASTN